MKEERDSTTAPAQETLVITRTFNAPLERVWKAWTEPEPFKRWWGGKDFTCPVCKIDLRVGGKILYCMRFTEGQDIWGTGVYREIVPLKKIVVTDSFADEQGNVVPGSQYGMDPDFPLELLVTLTFEEHDGMTRFTLRHEGFRPGPDMELTREGWNQSFDKLADSLRR